MAMPVPTAHGLMQQPKRRIDEEDPNAKFGPACPDDGEDSMMGKLFGGGSSTPQKKKVSFFQTFFCGEEA